MKLTYSKDGAYDALLLESDDGLHVAGYVSLQMIALHGGVVATAATIQDMFDSLDTRRRGEPQLGAMMQLKGGLVGGMVSCIDRDAETLCFGEARDVEHKWADCEYAS